jgi:hypothetical protein
MEIYSFTLKQDRIVKKIDKLDILHLIPLLLSTIPPFLLNYDAYL